MTDSASAKPLTEEQKAIFREYVRPWLALINDNKRYYLPKAMDIFIAMPAKHQEGLLRFICEKVPNERWVSKLEDNTQYLDVIRSMLYYYTGRKDAEEPTKEEFKNFLAGYIRSPFFDHAETSKEAETFHDLLEDL